MARSLDPNVREAIERAAKENGVNPAFALAVAERESSFNPNAHASKSMFGLFQMSGSLRRQYGSGDSTDPYTQASAWMPFIKDTRAQMASVLGREPSDAEAYTGHYYGPTRAARSLKMDPDTPTSSVFTPQEVGSNPNFARAGTVGRLNSSVMADIDARMARFGADAQDTSSTEPADLSSFGAPVELASSQDPSSNPQPADLSSFGAAVPQPDPQPAAAAPTDLSQFGTPA